MSRIRHATETFVNQMIAAVKKLIESNTNEINVLSEQDEALEKQISNLSKKNNMITYFTYSQVPSVGSQWTSLSECVKSLPNNCIFSGDLQGNFSVTTDFPSSSGVITIYKTTNTRCYIEFNTSVNAPKDSKKYYAWFRDVAVPEFYWQQISTTTKTDISSSSLLNGWTMWGNGYGDNLVGCKTGKQVQLNGLLRCGVKTQNTLILTLPKELRPTCSIIKNVSCYPYGTATIEIQSVGNVLVGNIGEGTLAISMGDVSYSTL